LRILSVDDARFKHMIEGDVRKLVGGVMSAGDSGSLKERLDRISALDHAVAMFQAVAGHAGTGAQAGARDHAR
jgi:hypothetical protein